MALRIEQYSLCSHMQPVQLVLAGPSGAHETCSAADITTACCSPHLSLRVLGVLGATHAVQLVAPKSATLSFGQGRQRTFGRVVFL